MNLTICAFAAKSGMSPNTVRKWVRREGLRPTGTREEKGRTFEIFDEAELEKITLAHKGVEKPTDPQLDPETGLTWHQAKTQEETRKLRLANEIEEKKALGELMPVADHHRILGAVISRLEQVPGKAQSELALQPQQVIGLRRMLDEARESAAKEIE